MNKWSSNETRETNFDGIFCIKWCSHVRNLNAIYIKHNDLIYILLVTVKSCNSWDTPNICCFPLVDGGLPVPGDSGGRLSSLETHSAETSVATLKVYYILYTDIWTYLYLLSLSLYIYMCVQIYVNVFHIISYLVHRIHIMLNISSEVGQCNVRSWTSASHGWTTTSILKSCPRLYLEKTNQTCSCMKISEAEANTRSLIFFWSTSHQHSGKDAKAQPHPTVAVKGVLGDQLAWKWSLHVFPVVSAGRPSRWHVVYFEDPRSAIAYGTHALTFTYQMIFIYSIYIS